MDLNRASDVCRGTPPRHYEGRRYQQGRTCYERDLPQAPQPSGGLSQIVNQNQNQNQNHHKEQTMSKIQTAVAGYCTVLVALAFILA